MMNILVNVQTLGVVSISLLWVSVAAYGTIVLATGRCLSIPGRVMKSHPAAELIV